MSTQPTLRRLETVRQEPLLLSALRSPALLIALPLLLGCAVLLGIGWASGWLPAQFVPRKVVVRGCQLTSSTEVFGLLGFSGSESVFELLRQSSEVTSMEDRWIRRLRVYPRLNRECVVDVTERRPVLAVSSNQQDLWLCDDGEMVSRNKDADIDANFEALEGQPLVVIHTPAESDKYPSGESLLTAASCCQQVLPGRIRKIEIGAKGEFQLIDQRDFRIVLGDDTKLAEKIGALPKALRLCEDKRERLQYLDASRPGRFYMKWKEAQS